MALVREAARALAARVPRVVLAVSGGLDSMVLLDVVAAVAPEAIAAVATFDHGTGAAASRAAALVAARCARLGIPVVTERAARAGRSEAEWREARWRFLREVARARGAPVATAHTRDDQLETVVMRVLRGAGARGLAGLYAPSDVERPLLGLSRAELARYARARRLRWVEDPSNASRAFLRNRVRLDLVPALRAADPVLPEALLALARRAAEWRVELDAFIDARLEPRVERPDAVSVARDALNGYDPAVLRVLWPAIAARVHATLDRRGTSRLAQFTTDGNSGGAVQLSGGWEAVRLRDRIVLRRRLPLDEAALAPRPLEGVVRIGRWSFRPVAAVGEQDAWVATLPASGRLTVRGWRPGDRMIAAGAPAPRRVKRFLRDAWIAGPDRAGWPVVLDDERIIWIPGVCRSDAAAVRSGRPGVTYLCERTDR